MGRTWWAAPAAAALAVTALNAAKPAVVDDTAYLLFARHIAAAPLDPYGFELFWYSQPHPAMKILAPPVVPYWLAAGVALLGEHLFLLKLWLLPFPLVLCFASWSLLHRFARGTEAVGVVMLALGPAVLPLVNFMLDVPAVALGVAAVAVFVRGCDRGRWGLVLAAGVLAGLAMQTKYTAMIVPAVFVWYGLLHRRLGSALVAGLVAVGLFAAWEVWLASVYGVSHFAYHAQDQQSGGPGVVQKLALVRPLLGFLGGLAVGWGLYAGRAAWFGERFVRAVAAVGAGGMLAVCVVPPDRYGPDFAEVVFVPLGVAVGVSLTVAVRVLLLRRGCRPRLDPAAWFLVGWLAIELGGYFALTPFPAARRVIPFCVVAGLIACRVVSRVRRVRPDRAPGRWVVAYTVGAGLGLWGLDTFDAYPERELAYRAAEVIGDRRGGRVWTQGHWGWQYYADRLGMRLVEPRRSELHAGDWLVVPVLPDEKGFYRPYHGSAKFRLEPSALTPTAELWWDDPVAGQTVPNLYGGLVPVERREHPRLRVAVYRVTRAWVPVP